MRKHAKKALKHEVSVKGKSIPTMIVLGLFLVGGTSAALLGNFGQITGEAQVNDAAITLDNGTGSVNWVWNDVEDQDLLGSEYYETHTLQSNVNNPAEVVLSSTCSRTYNSGSTTDTEDGPQTDMDLNWTDISGTACDGIQTRFLEYYDDAGHDFTDYEEPTSSDCQVTVGQGGGVDETTVQDGVDAASPGETVCVEPGTYTEQVIITNDVNVRGYGEDQTVIRSPDLTSPAVQSFSYDGKDNHPTVFVDGAEADIEGLTIDGDRQGIGSGSPFYGLAYRNAAGDLNHVEITNVTDSPFSGNQHGVALFVFNGDGTSRNVLADNLYLHDYQKNGIVASGDGLYFELNNSLVKGAGQTSINGQNGVQIDDSAEGKVSYSTVRDHYYTGSQYAASGLIIYDVDSLDVEFNNLDSNQITLVGTNSDITARSNNFLGDSPFEVLSQGASSNVDADNNWFGTDGITSAAYPGAPEPKVSYEVKSTPVQLSANETDKFGAYTSFALNLAPSDYNVTTQVLQN